MEKLWMPLLMPWETPDVAEEYVMKCVEGYWRVSCLYKVNPIDEIVIESYTFTTL